jgi:hypothetical protein
MDGGSITAWSVSRLSDDGSVRRRAQGNQRGEQ